MNFEEVLNIEMNFIKSKIFIITENEEGKLYFIETDEYNEIVNDWYGDCSYVPADNAKVYFASYDGVAINPYLYKDFASLITYLRKLILETE